MIRYEDECVGCPPEMGCLGSSCPNMHVPILVCDVCNDDCDELYQVDDKQVCKYCLPTLFEKVEV